MHTKLEIVNSVDEITDKPQNAVLEKAKQRLSNPEFTLSWSHYLILMRVENPDARSFYEIECAQQQWSAQLIDYEQAVCEMKH